MAQKKAISKSKYKQIEYEAKGLVLEWFDTNDFLIDEDSLYIVWVGLTKNGYRCLVRSTDFINNFFEINNNNGELICTCLKRFEYIVKLPNTSKLKRFIA